MPKRNLIIVLAALAATIVALWVTRRSDVLLQQVMDIGDFEPVYRAYQILRTRHYPVTRPAESQPATSPSTPATDIRQAAVKAMVDALADPYTSYIPPGRSEAFSQRMRGRAHGTGLVLRRSDDDFVVLGSRVDSPARRAGILGGEHLLAVNGAMTAGKTLAQVQAMLDDGNGKISVLLRRGKTAEVTVELTRQSYPLESVVGLYRDASGNWVCDIPGRDNLVYLRIREFVPDTLDRVHQLLRSLAIDGMVLDLRDNPGGEFNSALAMADLFLSKGVIVTVRSRSGEPVRYEAHANGTLEAFPLVVLINDRSASGAEILAGAMAIHDRAVLLGERTCGKGCVQEQIPINGLGQINLTTSEYFVGLDQPISFQGIVPHIVMPLDTDARATLEDLWIKTDLAPSVLATTAPAAATAAAAATRQAVDLLDEDTQLRAAVQLLRRSDDLQQILLGARTARLAARAASQPATNEAP